MHMTTYAGSYGDESDLAYEYIILKITPFCIESCTLIGYQCWEFKHYLMYYFVH